MLRNTGVVLVSLMVLLQLVYAVFAHFDPAGFAALRGTALVDAQDADWVRIYASRTLFVVVIVGYLLYLKQFKLLAAASLFGVVMPASDAYLALQASASSGVVLKHVATAVFLIVTSLVLRSVGRREVA